MKKKSSNLTDGVIITRDNVHLQGCTYSRTFCKRLPSHWSRAGLHQDHPVGCLVVCSSPCRKWPHSHENGFGLPPPVTTFKVKKRFPDQTRKEEQLVQPVFCIVDAESCSVISRIYRVYFLPIFLKYHRKEKVHLFPLIQKSYLQKKVCFSPLIRKSQIKFNFFPLILKPFTVSPEFTSTLVKQKFQAALKLLKISSSLKLCQLCFNARIASKNIWSGNLN